MTGSELRRAYYEAQAEADRALAVARRAEARAALLRSRVCDERDDPEGAGSALATAFLMAEWARAAEAGAVRWAEMAADEFKLEALSQRIDAATRAA